MCSATIKDRVKPLPLKLDNLRTLEYVVALMNKRQDELETWVYDLQLRVNELKKG